MGKVQGETGKLQGEMGKPHDTMMPAISSTFFNNTMLLSRFSSDNVFSSPELAWSKIQPARNQLKRLLWLSAIGCSSSLAKRIWFRAGPRICDFGIITSGSGSSGAPRSCSGLCGPCCSEPRRCSALRGEVKATPLVHFPAVFRIALIGWLSRMFPCTPDARAIIS